jgi:hypothetical protein
VSSFQHRTKLCSKCSTLLVSASHSTVYLYIRMYVCMYVCIYNTRRFKTMCVSYICVYVIVTGQGPWFKSWTELQEDEKMNGCLAVSQLT